MAQLYLDDDDAVGSELTAGALLGDEPFAAEDCCWDEDDDEGLERCLRGALGFVVQTYRERELHWYVITRCNARRMLSKIQQRRYLHCVDVIS